MRMLPMLVALGLLAATAAADDAALRARVVQLLSGYERGPTPAELRRMGTSLAPTLMAIHDDRTQPTYVRLRALRAGAAFPTRAMRAYLVALARDPNAPELAAREAVIALGEGFGTAVLVDLGGFLSDARPAVREGAVLALSRSSSPRAAALLARHAGAETDEGVRDLIRRERIRATSTDPVHATGDAPATSRPVPR